MDIKAVAAKYNDYLIEMRRRIHENPEEGGKEFQTSQLIKDELDKEGISWEPCGMETGVKAVIQGGKPGKTILLRADMDALAVPEETGLPYCSKNEGISHACGHDCHTATLLTAARILNEVKDELPGKVVLAFQPAEEIAQGARAMIADGVLEGIDTCFGIHVWGGVQAGTFNCEPGPRMAACREFQLRIVGKGGHGALPQNCKDPIVGGAAIIGGLQTIVSRHYAPSDSVVVTVGEFTSGSRWNIIASDAIMTGTTRCYKDEIHDTIMGEVLRVAKGVGEGYGVGVEVLKDVNMTIPTVNDEFYAKLAEQSAIKIMGEAASVPMDPTTAGEDFGMYSKAVPGAFMFLGISNEEKCYANHHPKFDVDESVLINGAAIYAQVAFDFNAQ